MKFVPHYRGDLSKQFWRRVNQLDDKENVLYLMGCALQDIEGRMLQAIESRESCKRSVQAYSRKCKKAKKI